MSHKKSSRAEKWLSVILPTVVLVVGLLLLGRQAVSSFPRTDAPLPDAVSQVDNVSADGANRASTGQPLVVRMNKWQATSLPTTK